MFLGLCILFFLDVCTFLIVFSGRLKFVDLKINKAVSKDLNEEDHGQSKNEGFEAFERVISNIFERNFFNRSAMLLSCKFML